MAAEVLRKKEFLHLDPIENLNLSNYLVNQLNYEMNHRIGPRIQKAIQSLEDSPDTYDDKLFNENDFMEFRNWLDIAIKITNTANRVQATKGILEPDLGGSTEFSDLKTIAKLVYFGQGKFGRLFLNDKGGKVNRKPTLIPLSAVLNNYMAVYLCLLQKMKAIAKNSPPQSQSSKKTTTQKKQQVHKPIEINSEGHPRLLFPSHNGTKWTTASVDLYAYMCRLWDIKINTPKNKQSTAENTPNTHENKVQRTSIWRQHMMRCLFLNRVAMTFKFEEHVLKLASTLMRHDISELHKSYTSWCKYMNGYFFFHGANIELEITPLEKMNTDTWRKSLAFCVQQCEILYSINVRPEEEGDIPDARLLPRSAKNLEKRAKKAPLAEANIHITLVNQRKDVLGFIGIDASPSCVAVVVGYVANENRQVYVFEREPTDERKGISQFRLPYAVTDDVKGFVKSMVKEIQTEIQMQKFVIGIESPLSSGVNVDKKTNHIHTGTDRGTQKSRSNGGRHTFHPKIA